MEFSRNSQSKMGNNKGYTTRNIKHPTGNHGFVGDTGGWE